MLFAMFLRFKMSEADYNRAVGQYITTKRMEAGLSQIELANSASISRSTMSDLEKGSRLPSGKDMLSLCNALKVTPNDIYSCGGKKIAFASNDDHEVKEHIKDLSIIIQTAYCFFKLNKASKESIHDVVYKMAQSEHGEEVVLVHQVIAEKLNDVLSDPMTLEMINKFREAKGKPVVDIIDFDVVLSFFEDFGGALITLNHSNLEGEALK